MNPTDTQQSLRQRLLLAISTGALLAAPGCGGSTSPDPDDAEQPSRGTDGADAGGSGSAGTTNTTTGASSTEGTTGRASGGAGGVGGTGVGAAGGAGGVGTGRAGGVGTAGGAGGSGGVGASASDASGGATSGGSGGSAGLGGSSATTGAGTGGEQNYSCEPGFLTEFCLTREQMELQARNGLGEIPMDPPRRDEEIAGGYDENGCMRPDWVGTGCCNPGLEPGIPNADECCYVACEAACCGRPLVLSGQAVTAPAASRSDWVTVKLDTLGVSHQAPRALADLWQADALAEHASVASFARFTLQLLALGAPSELVLDAQRAALDEIDHARRCFDIASRLSGRLIGPGRLAEASASVPTDLAEVVVATIHEGCVGETLAAAMASEQALVAEDPEVRESLLKIAEDEARHAELAWRFVAWALQRADTRVRRLAHAAFSQALARSDWPVDPARSAIDRSSLHAWGQLSPEESQAVAQRTLTGVVGPAAERLLASGDQGATAHAGVTHA